MSFKWMIAAVAAAICLASVVGAAGRATAAGGPPSIAAGPAFGFVPSHNVNHQAARDGEDTFPAQWHSGPVMHSTTVAPIYWGSRWTTRRSPATRSPAWDYFYSGVGGTEYARTNGGVLRRLGKREHDQHLEGKRSERHSATPSGAPSTTQVLAEVAKMTSNKPVASAYYPVYSDQPRGSAGYCAWHSSGTINGIQVAVRLLLQPRRRSGLRSAVTVQPRPQPGPRRARQRHGPRAQRDAHRPAAQRLERPAGAENSDKCAWTFCGTVRSAARAGRSRATGATRPRTPAAATPTRGCIQTS